MVAWGAALAAGGSLAGGLIQGRQAKKSSRSARRRINLDLYKGKSEFNRLYGLGEQALQQRIGGIGAAKQETLAEFSRLGGSARQGVLDREQQSFGAIGSDLSRRGLGNTTVGANLRRGVVSDTNRSLQSITEGLANLRGGAISQYAGMESGAYGDLANFYARQGQGQFGIQQALANVWGGGGGGQQPMDLSGIGSFIDQLMQKKGGSGGLGGKGF